MLHKLSKLCESAFSNLKITCKSTCCNVVIEHDNHNEVQQSPKNNDIDENNKPPAKLADIFVEPNEQSKKEEQKNTDEKYKV